MPRNKIDKDPDSNSKGSGFWGKAGGVGKYIISPYMFSKKDGSLLGTHNPVKGMKKNMPESNVYADMAEVYEANPEFESIRKLALSKLKRKRNFLFILLIGLIIAFYGFDIFNPFPIDWMNRSIEWIFLANLFMLGVVTDIQYLVYKFRLFKLSFVGWIRMRL